MILTDLLKTTMELIENLAVDVNRIYIGLLILLFVTSSYFLNLDLLLYSVIVILTFVELRISKILSSKNILFFSCLYLFLFFLYSYVDLFIIFSIVIFFLLIISSFFNSHLKYIFTTLILPVAKPAKVKSTEIFQFTMN